jgi:probable phosphoglycerate mutase
MKDDCADLRSAARRRRASRSTRSTKERLCSALTHSPRLIALIALLVAVPSRVIAQTSPPHTIVYVIRHAERASEDYDSPLAPAGVERAEVLARMLGEAGITQLHSTPFQRTQGTLAPLAARLGLPVQEYDATSQAALVSRIRETRGRHLVVGHSNTVPELVRLLGGEPGTPIAMDEHDRLYVVTIASDGSVSSSLLRYGFSATARHSTQRVSDAARVPRPSLRAPTAPFIFAPARSHT